MSRPFFVGACHEFSVSFGDFLSDKTGGDGSEEWEDHGRSQIEQQWNSKNETQDISRLQINIHY